MPKLITPDLRDTFKEDNQQFFNLLNRARWDQLIDQAKDGQPIDVLLKELITDEHEVIE